MRVLITGGTGFVGSFLVPRLVCDGHEVVLLTHRTAAPTSEKGIEIAVGNVLRPDTLAAAARDCEAILHLVGILKPSKGASFEEMHVDAVRNVVAAAHGAGIPRVVHMSANGVGRGIATEYMRTKERGEEVVRTCGLAWTILRPSFIFGPGGDMEGLLRTLVATRVAPVLGGGHYEVAPVDARDVAAAFSHALARPASVGKTYELCGPDAVEFRDLLSRAAAARGHGLARVPVPMFAGNALAHTLGRMRLFPATPDQLTMLAAGNTCGSDDWTRALDVEPRGLDEQLRFMFAR